MAWRFRQSFSPLPGVRITLSPSGVSTFVGAGPLRATIGPQGPRVTAIIPGTGLSFIHSFGGAPQQRFTDLPAPISPQWNDLALQPASQPLDEIKSAGSGALTTHGLREFKRLLEEAHREQGAIARELSHVRNEESLAVKGYLDWKNGWLKRRLFKARFEQLRHTAEETTAKRTELSRCAKVF